jgi:surface protein
MHKIGVPLLFILLVVSANAQTEFITTWKTDNLGSSADNQITIPTFPDETYDYNIDWGDGTADSNVTGNITHTYATSGNYQVSITGIFPRIYFHNNGFDLNEGDKDKIILVNQWGDIQWTSMSDAFLGCTNLDIVATDLPDLSNVFIMDDMFNQCSSLIANPTIGDWDLSNVVITAGMFSGATNFNQPIGNWDMKNVINTSAMFASAVSFNQSIGNWDVGKVIYMESMFSNAKSFDQPIGNWNVSRVENMILMFAQASSFNQDIGNWDVGNVKSMRLVFSGCSSFNQDLNNWNVENVTSMERMFRNALVFNQDIGNWDVSQVTDMSLMFEGAMDFDQNLGTWDVSKVTTMSNMFANNSLSTHHYDQTLIGWYQLPSLQNNVVFDGGFSQYCNSAIERLKLMYEKDWIIQDDGKTTGFCAERPFITTWKTDNPGASASNQITIPTFPGEWYNYTIDWGDGTFYSNINSDSDITHTYVTPGTYMVSISGEFPRIQFSIPGDDNLKLLSIDQWGDIKWKSMQGAFFKCENLDVLAEDVPDLSMVTSVASMFDGCKSLIGNQSFKVWDLSTVTNMQAMFGLAEKFNQPIGNWNVGNVQTMDNLFNNALSFNQDISKWEVSNVTNMFLMFSKAESFNQDISEWDVSNVENMAHMFGRASSFDSDLSSWNVGNVVDMSAMFEFVGLSLENYNKLLIGWSGLPALQPDVPFDAGYSTYCEAADARQALIDNYGWAIWDGGEAPFCNQDNDTDGVLDHLDDCLNTASGAVVDANGCEIISANAISIYVETPTCINESNGSMAISTVLVDYSFNISIASTTLNTTYTEISLNEVFKIEDLPAGLYTITVEIPNALYEQTFGVTINEVNSVTGKRLSIDAKNKTVTYIVSGSYQYSADINGKSEIFTFDSTAPHEIQLTGLGDYNSISITGKDDCQGKVEDTFNVSGEIFVHPIMTKGEVFVHGVQSTAEVRVYDMSGRIIIEKDIGRDTNESVNLEGYRSGMYPIKIISEGNTKVFKIIKQ